MKQDDVNGGDFTREAMWVTPDSSRMPHCKVCKIQGCMHFRRGFAHLLALNQVRLVPLARNPKQEQAQGSVARVRACFSRTRCGRLSCPGLFHVPTPLLSVITREATAQRGIF